MNRPVSIKDLLSSDERKVVEIIAQLQASQGTPARELWTDRLSASARGGKGLN